jgi:hypothetical protein
MIRDRAELENNLREVIEQVKYKRRNIELVNKYLSQFDIPAGTFNEIAKTDSPINKLDVTILCLLTLAVFEVSQDADIRPEDFFTPREIEEAKKYKQENNSDIDLPITLYDVLQLDYENYLTTIKMSDLMKFYHSGLIVYDFETQRSPSYKKGRGEGIVPVPDINLTAVREITEHMLNGTYLPDVMTLNVFGEDEPISYNPKTKTFIINKESVISILDGFHRLQAGIRATSENPELPLVMGLAIKTFDTDTARKFFGQINSATPVRKERIAELKQEKLSYISVKQLQINSDLRGKISTGSTTNDFQYTTVDILANTIDDVFEPRNTFEAREIGNYLSEFFNYLLGMFPEEFNNKNSYLRHYRMFIGYITFAKQFKDNNIPLDKIKYLIDNLNIDENKELIEVITESRGTSSRLQKKVREYFSKINVKDILKIGA